jgi:hypothetical protein
MVERRTAQDRWGAVDGKNVDWMEKVTEEQYNMTTNPNTPGNDPA